VENGISLEIIWFDRDVTEVVFNCSNGRFAGIRIEAAAIDSFVAQLVTMDRAIGAIAVLPMATGRA
jgi:hypothetical protein